MGLWQGWCSTVKIHSETNSLQLEPGSREAVRGWPGSKISLKDMSTVIEDSPNAQSPALEDQGCKAQARLYKVRQVNT